jgi:histidinol-phosphatase (PHP family)
MNWPADYHMHTPLCRHASGEPTEYAAQALALGIQEIGFTDHSPMRADDFDNWRMRFDQLDEYVDKVRKAQKDHPNLVVRLSLEVDYLPGQEDWIRELAAKHPWDYLIGSVHYISESWAIDDPHRISEWKHRDAFEVWSAYFDRLTMAAESKLFDIIGHADLPKKFGIVPSQSCTPLFRRFLTAAQKSGVAVELNTAGLRKDCKEIYPSPAFVQLMHEHRIPITFGSDAHAIAEVGCDFDKALHLACSTGYTHYLRFEKRRASTTSIPG